MYVKYYKFKGKPFGINPDPKFFFNSKTHKRALSCLGYGLGQGQGFIIITGDPGTGKTTLMSALSHMLASTNIITASIINTQLQDDEMLRYVAAELGLPFEGVSKISLLKSIETFFAECIRNDNRVIIIIDEAQNISDSAIEELRMLMNLVKGSEAVLQFVLFGQSSLKKQLLSDPFESIRQRTVASYELTHLGEEETKAYITLRLRAVGWVGEPDISPGAYLAIYENSQGIPAKVNMICGKLLQSASVKRLHLIIEEDVQNIDREMNQNFSDAAFSGSLVEGVVDAIMEQRMEALTARKSIGKQLPETTNESNNPIDKVKSDSAATFSVEVDEVVDVESRIVDASLESVSQEIKPASNSDSEREIPEVVEPDITQTLELDIPEAVEPDITQTLELDIPEAVEPDITQTLELDIPEAVEPDITQTLEFDIPEVVEPDITQTLVFDIPEVVEPEITQTLEFDAPELITVETHDITEPELSETLELTAPESLVLDETTKLEEEMLSSEFDETVVLELDVPSPLGFEEMVSTEQDDPVPQGMDETIEIEQNTLESIEHEGTFSVDTEDLSVEKFELVAADSFDMEELESIVASDADTLELESVELLKDEIAIQETIESLEVPVVDDLELIGLDDSEDTSDIIPTISEQVSSEQAFMETSELFDSGEVDTEIQEWLQKKKKNVNGTERKIQASQTGEISVNDFENTLEDQK